MRRRIKFEFKPDINTPNPGCDIGNRGAREFVGAKQSDAGVHGHGGKR